MPESRSGKARAGLLIVAAGTLVAAVAGVAAALVISKRALKRPDAPAPAPVQSTAIPGAVQQTAHVSVKTSVEPARAAGSPTTLLLEITPAPKVHIYAPGQQGYIPVELTLEPSPQYSAQPAAYPNAVTVMLPAIQEKARVYNETFQVRQPIALAPAAAKKGAKAQPIEVVGRLRYQACDDLVCYRPETIKIVWTVAVE
jgi:Disulphide bond corrector protein DsbC